MSNWPASSIPMGTILTPPQWNFVFQCIGIAADNYNLSGFQLQNASYKSPGAGVVADTFCIHITAPDFTAGGSATVLNGLKIEPLAGANVGTPYAISQLGSSDNNYLAGKLGAGTNAPTAQLHVSGLLAGSMSSSNNIGAVAKFSDGGVNSNMGVVFDTGATPGPGALRGFFIGKASQTFAIVRFDSSNSFTGGPFYDFFVDSAGRVGIGSTSPTSPLQVSGVPTYSSDSAAGTAGLTAGAMYKDSSGNSHFKL